MQNSVMFFILTLIVTLSLGCGQKQDQPVTGQTSDARAIQIAEQVIKTLGGQTAWNHATYVSFRWAVERNGKDVADYRHDWDRASNNYRLEGTRRDGKHLVVNFNTMTKQGKAFLNGELVREDSTQAKLIDYAYGRYINDSYWFIMPLKLLDPGVTLAVDSETELNGAICDVLKMTFEKVGLTPGDTYWIYIDRQEHLVRKWEYHLEGWDADRERGGSTWEDWQVVTGVKLAMNRQFLSGKGRIYFKEVNLASTPDAAIFSNMSRMFGEGTSKDRP